MIRLGVQNGVTLQPGQRAQITVSQPSRRSGAGEGPYTIFVIEQGEKSGDVNMMVFFCDTLEEFAEFTQRRYAPAEVEVDTLPEEDWPPVIGDNIPL